MKCDGSAMIPALNEFIDIWKRWDKPKKEQLINFFNFFFFFLYQFSLKKVDVYT